MAGYWRYQTFTALAVLLMALSAPAAERVALVIGNAQYAHASRLANPLNDAAGIGKSFETTGDVQIVNRRPR